MNYAVVEKNTKVVINNIEWDGVSFLESSIIDNYDLIPWDDSTKGKPINLGDSYDDIHAGFKSPSPYPSWIFDATIWGWEAPIPYPEDGNSYTWNEELLQWDLIS